MDEDTLTIGYRHWRGEPRGKHRKGPGAENLGDCIDCNACVNVCPMGIDIREGQQLACITCGLCIDACNDVMDRIGKPRELIGYMALSDEQSEAAGATPHSVWSHVFRPRTVLYSTLWGAVGVGLLVALFIRTDIDMSVSPIRNPTHVVMSDGSVRNAYDVRLRNMHGEPRTFELSLSADSAIEMSLQGEEGLEVTVPADQQYLQRVYLTAAPGSEPAAAGITDVRIWASIVGESERIHSDTVFNGGGQ